MKRGTEQKKWFSLTLGTVMAATVSFFLITSCTDETAKAKPNFIVMDPPKPGLVAKIGDQEITEDELIGDDKLDFFDLKKREYDLKMERLNKLLVDKLIGAEAKAAGMSLDDYIDKKVVGNKTKVSERDFKKFVTEKHIPESQLNPQIKDRIMAYLESQKKQDVIQDYVAKLTHTHPVEVYFSRPKGAMNVDVANAPLWGKANAPVTIVEFSDFQCPFCSRAAETMAEVKKKYAGKIRVAYKHFPLPMHRDARPTAEASMCVYDQGNDKFWKFHDIVFKNQEKMDAESIEGYAKEAGVDAAKYEDCVKSHKFADYVAKDQAYGEKLGIKSTPTFFINGQLVSGAVPFENFAEVIDEELADTKKN